MKWVRFLWGLALAPLTLATLYHLPSFLFSKDTGLGFTVWLFLGAAGYLMFEKIFSRPMRSYVFGHELTHAVAALALGAKVHSFHASKQGGNVSLSKSNFLIALAPYCFPIYTLILLAVYFILTFLGPWPGLVRDPEKFRAAFLAAIGFSLAFHCSLTVFAMREGQPDIQKTGVFFSLVFILLVNCWVLALLLKALFPGSVALGAFFEDTLKTQWAIWGWMIESVGRWFRKASPDALPMRAV